MILILIRSCILYIYIKCISAWNADLWRNSRCIDVYNVPGAGQNDEYVVVTNEPSRFSPNQQSVVRTGTPDSYFVTLEQEF